VRSIGLYVYQLALRAQIYVCAAVFCMFATASNTSSSPTTRASHKKQKTAKKGAPKPKILVTPTNVKAVAALQRELGSYNPNGSVGLSSAAPISLYTAHRDNNGEFKGLVQLASGDSVDPEVTFKYKAADLSRQQREALLVSYQRMLDEGKMNQSRKDFLALRTTYDVSVTWFDDLYTTWTMEKWIKESQRFTRQLVSDADLEEIEKERQTARAAHKKWGRIHLKRAINKKAGRDLHRDSLRKYMRRYFALHQGEEHRHVPPDAVLHHNDG
jgi:hypothetical protein